MDAAWDPVGSRCSSGSSPSYNNLKPVMAAAGHGSLASGNSTRKLPTKLDYLDPGDRQAISKWLVRFRAAAGADFKDLFIFALNPVSYTHLTLPTILRV